MPPGRWRFLDEDVRRCGLRVFPYSVLYTVAKQFCPQPFNR